MTVAMDMAGRSVEFERRPAYTARAYTLGVLLAVVVSLAHRYSRSAETRSASPADVTELTAKIKARGSNVPKNCAVYSLTEGENAVSHQQKDILPENGKKSENISTFLFVYKTRQYGTPSQSLLLLLLLLFFFLFFFFNTLGSKDPEG